jgi:hypothetical protein
MPEAAWKLADPMIQRPPAMVLETVFPPESPATFRLGALPSQLNAVSVRAADEVLIVRRHADLDELHRRIGARIPPSPRRSPRDGSSRAPGWP